MRSMIFLLFFALTAVLNAQNRYVSDSLIKQLENNPNDSLSFEIHRKLGFYHPNPVEALLHSKLAFGLASESGNVFNIARALERIGEVQGLLGNKKEGYEATYKALAIYDSLNLKKRKAHLLLQIAVKLTYDQDYEEAKIYFNQSLNAFDKAGDVSNRIATLINFGESLRKSNELDQAVDKFMEAIQLNKELNNSRYQAYALGNLGMTHRALKKLSIASQELKVAVSILNKLEDPFSVVTYEGEIGQIELARNNKEKGLQRIQRAFELAKKYQIKEQIKELSILLSASYEEVGQFDKSLHYHKIAKVYYDSLNNVANVRNIEQLKAIYQLEKKNKEIAYQQIEIKKGVYQRNITLAVVVLLIVILAISIVAYRLKQRDNRLLADQKSEIAEREKQKNWLLGEMQHRTKNNLQMISSLLNMQSRKLIGHPSYEAIKDGKTRVDALAIIHQQLYQEEGQLKINLYDYLHELVESLVYSFDKEVDIHYDIQDFELDVDKAVPIALIVNELVTNALKYAYAFTSNPKLSIKFIQNTEANILLEVGDNGRGIGAKALNQKDTFGFKLVTSLINQLKGTLLEQNVSTGCIWAIKFNTNEFS